MAGATLRIQYLLYPKRKSGVIQNSYRGVWMKAFWWIAWYVPTMAYVEGDPIHLFLSPPMVMVHQIVLLVCSVLSNRDMTQFQESELFIHQEINNFVGRRIIGGRRRSSYSFSLCLCLFDCLKLPKR
ncbi:uncharacterized protein [Spinacia oleracea]|uniref:Uncharacterized protein n=1 Tax=Spinacia oleracea TaxID=3562 RepID=A0A9R0JYT7_SPIOL|nr:uncharacterized protein LOC110791704 [Spinacia oleracea]